MQEETPVVAATESFVDRKHNRLLLHQKRRLERRKPFWEKRPESVQKTSSKESVRIRRVIFGILPYVKITSVYRDAKSATIVCLDTLRVEGSPVKSRSKVVVKDQLPN